VVSRRPTTSLGPCAPAAKGMKPITEPRRATKEMTVVYVHGTSVQRCVVIISKRLAVLSVTLFDPLIKQKKLSNHFLF
jgi:hypothetical protein